MQLLFFTAHELPYHPCYFPCDRKAEIRVIKDLRAVVTAEKVAWT
jgi:hypothetical protein